MWKHKLKVLNGTPFITCIVYKTVPYHSDSVLTDPKLSEAGHTSFSFSFLTVTLLLICHTIITANAWQQICYKISSCLKVLSLVRKQHFDKIFSVIPPCVASSARLWLDEATGRWWVGSLATSLCLPDGFVLVSNFINSYTSDTSDTFCTYPLAINRIGFGLQLKP